MVKKLNGRLVVPTDSAKIHSYEHYADLQNSATNGSDSKRRSLLAKPFLERCMRLKSYDLDAIDRRLGLPDMSYFLLRHLADPQQPMPLETGMGEGDGTVLERPIEIASSDEYEVDKVP